MRCPCPVLRSMVAACVILAAGSARAADPALIEAAKKEGEVIWYTTQIISQLVRPVSAAFEKKYGIKVRSTRANSTELSVKIINESRAGRPQSDVFDGTSTVVPLKKEGFVLQWQPDRGQVLSGAVQGPGGLLGREQSVLPHAGFQHQRSFPRERSRAAIRRCSIRNGAARWPGAPRRRARAAPASSARC